MDTPLPQPQGSDFSGLSGALAASSSASWQQLSGGTGWKMIKTIPSRNSLENGPWLILFALAGSGWHPGVEPELTKIKRSRNHFLVTTVQVRSGNGHPHKAFLQACLKGDHRQPSTPARLILAKRIVATGFVGSDVWIILLISCLIA